MSLNARLPPIARHVDAELAALDDRIDWLTALSPLHEEAMWDAFQHSGYQEVPPFEYPPQRLDLHALRVQLLELPVEDVELPLLQALLVEKQRELDRQLELIRLRGTEGFVVASIDLFGDAEPELLRLARRILRDTPRDAPSEAPTAGWQQVVAAAEQELAYYRARCPDLDAQIVVSDDLSSKLMVSQGHLHVARSIRVPQPQVEALLQHEIGIHVITRYNGEHQPLRQLACGLAHYDTLQEGLGALAEYLWGYLPPDRLRVLAARVVATDWVLRGRQLPTLYRGLTDEYDLPPRDAFDVAVRACRGGGLTKDVVYLRGLRDLLCYLQDGGDLATLFIGKFALAQLPMLQALDARGLVRPPALLPRWLDDAAARERLQRARTVQPGELHTTS